MTWSLCFFAFLTANTSYEETRELAPYDMVVLQLAQKHEVNGLPVYDWQFHQQQAAGASLSWDKINPSQIAVTIVSVQVTFDHSREDTPR